MSNLERAQTAAEGQRIRADRLQAELTAAKARIARLEAEKADAIAVGNSNFSLMLDAQHRANDAEADAARYREALVRIEVGDELRPLGVPYRQDRKPSKHDKCTHGVWRYETCGECIADFARRALQPHKETRT